MKALRVLRVGDGILYRTHDSWVAAGYYQSRDIVNSFSRAGVAVQLKAFGRILNQEPTAAFPLSDAEVTPCGIEVPGPGISALIQNLKSAVVSLREQIASSDAVWAMLPSMLGLLAIHLSAGKKPCVAQLVGDPRQSIESLGTGLKTKMLARLASKILKPTMARADGSLFVSNALRALYGRASQPSLVANESRLDHAQFIDYSTMEYVHEGLRQKNPSIVYVGRLSPEKGVSVLLRAIAKIPELELSIIGNGAQESELRELAIQMGISQRVSFLGFHPWGDGLLDLIRSHHALVLPSLTEGLPLVLLEAMSQGTPVIASSAGGMPELVTDGVNGLLAPPGDAEALANAVSRLVGDPRMRWSFAEAGLRIAAENTAAAQYNRSVGFLLNIVSEKRYR